MTKPGKSCSNFIDKIKNLLSVWTKAEITSDNKSEMIIYANAKQLFTDLRVKVSSAKFSCFNSFYITTI